MAGGTKCFLLLKESCRRPELMSVCSCHSVCFSFLMPNSFVSWLSGEKHACGLVESIKTSVILTYADNDCRQSPDLTCRYGFDEEKNVQHRSRCPQDLGPMNSTVPQEILSKMQG